MRASDAASRRFSIGTLLAVAGLGLAVVSNTHVASATMQEVVVYSAVPEFGPLPAGVNAEVRVLSPVGQRYITGRSWRPGCPVPRSDLRAVMVRYVDFAGQDRVGPLLVHRTHARKIARVMERLFAARFPIDQILPVDEFGADDDRSTLANNTSAFNCRPVSGTQRWSQHALGAAIDINPVQNPYVRTDGSVLDPAAKPFVNRANPGPGLIRRNDAVVQAFAAIGWGWGGDWRTTKDYQHFSASGR